MREIKFRMWDKTSEEYDYPSKWSKIVFPDILECEDIITEQYTGLHDKNGKEVYEGDLVKYMDDYGSFFISEVKYFAGVDDYPAFDTTPPDDDWNFQSNTLQTGIIEGSIEVVGNIHENADLLEVSK